LTILKQVMEEKLNEMKAAVDTRESMRLEAEDGLETAIKGLELLAKESFKIGNDIHNEVKKLSGELEAEQKERDNECSMLKRFVQNLEGQVTTHVEELRFNHEAEVKKRNVAYEKLEQTHRELKGGLDAHGANHLKATQDVVRTLQRLEKMIEQEVKVGEDDTRQTGTTMSFVSDRLDTDSCKRSERMGDLSDRLKKLSDELGTDVRLGEINETRGGLQRGLIEHLEGLKLSADVERRKRTDDRLGRKLSYTRSNLRQQEIQPCIHSDDQLLSCVTDDAWNDNAVEGAADHVQHEPLDESSGQRNVLDVLVD